MQGKGFSLRLGLWACVAVLIFGMLGGLSLAKDAFDDDYDDCPARTRIDAINGLTIDRTDEAGRNSSLLGCVGHVSAQRFGSQWVQS